MTARFHSTTTVHAFKDATIDYRCDDELRWATVVGGNGLIHLFDSDAGQGGSHADVAATLIRLAGEALPHLDDEGRAVVLAAVHEAFTPPAALDPMRVCTCHVSIRSCLCHTPDPMGSPAEVGRT